jgi:AraC family ethanolamine operon transcriptional activator
VKALCSFGRKLQKRATMKSFEFNEFDAFAETVRDVDAVMTMQNPEHRVWKIKQTALEGLHVQLGQVGSGNIVEGQSWSDGILLYLPLSADVTYRVNGVTLGAEDFMVLDPSREFCIATKHAHDWCTVLLPQGDPSPDYGTHDVAWRATRELGGRFQYAVREILRASANSTYFADSVGAKVAAAQLQEVASAILTKPKPSITVNSGRPRLSRKNVLQVCNEMIEARAGLPIRVADLIAATGVPERTLRQVFQDYFGMGPLRYLKLRQLNQVFAALRTADPKTTKVGDVLVANGIWEFGRFSSNYRRLFGENPSQTLRGSQAK